MESPPLTCAAHGVLCIPSYSKPLLTKGGAAIPDYEKGRKEVEQVNREFVQEYTAIMNAIRIVRSETCSPPTHGRRESTLPVGASLVGILPLLVFPAQSLPS